MNAMMAADGDLVVMINGMPGPMATEVAIACIDRGIQVADKGLTGPNTGSEKFEVKVLLHFCLGRQQKIMSSSHTPSHYILI